MDNNPFSKKTFKNASKGLAALDAAAEKQMEESRYTVDGALLEKGLEVWCVDKPLYDKPWKILREYRCRDGWAIRRCGDRHTAFYNRLFVSKAKAIVIRMGILKKEVQFILREKIKPIEEEIAELVEEYLHNY